MISFSISTASILPHSERACRDFSLRTKLSFSYLILNFRLQTQTSEFSILTDEEINKAKKIGEMKQLMPRLNAIAYKISDIRIASLPEEQQEFERSKAKLEAIQLEASTKKYNEHLSTYGPDDTFMPEPNRTYLLKEVIYYRDIIKKLAHKFGLDQ